MNFKILFYLENSKQPGEGAALRRLSWKKALKKTYCQIKNLKYKLENYMFFQFKL